ncbi:MAG: OmpH family outer membrane protein [Syntrophales bacterium]|nr:OmpH family outer membrane protein [Syntrophales bacterium]
MNKRLILGLFSLILFAALGGDLWARTVKVGVVDMQRVLRESQVVKEAREAFLQDIKTKRDFLASREMELIKQEQEIKKLPAKTSAKERQEKLDKLKNDVRELRYLREDLEAELKRKDTEIGSKHLGDIIQVVRKYAQEEGYTTIIDRATVIAVDDDLDITAAIIKRYDAQKNK